VYRHASSNELKSRFKFARNRTKVNASRGETERQRERERGSACTRANPARVRRVSTLEGDPRRESIARFLQNHRLPPSPTERVAFPVSFRLLARRHRRPAEIYSSAIEFRSAFSADSMQRISADAYARRYTHARTHARTHACASAAREKPVSRYVRFNFTPTSRRNSVYTDSARFLTRAFSVLRCRCCCCCCCCCCCVSLQRNRAV